MNKVGWILLIVVMVAVTCFWKRQRAGLTVIAPRQCLFNVDDNWSLSFQEAIIRSITTSYEALKNPDAVISKITDQFPEINSVQAQICSADKICFYVEAARPVFILNDTYVVGSTGHLSPKDDFAPEVQSSLARVRSQQDGDIPAMIAFVAQLPPEIVSSYEIDWIDSNSIILIPQSMGTMRCLACTDNIPSIENMKRCHDLHEDFLRSGPVTKKKKKIMEYDIRFKNQIIVRSGG